jgi:hypothetical protein
VEARTGVCVPFVFVMGAFLFADELLIHDFLELDHCGGGVCGVRLGGWYGRLLDEEDGMRGVVLMRCAEGAMNFLELASTGQLDDEGTWRFAAMCVRSATIDTLVVLCFFLHVARFLLYSSVNVVACSCTSFILNGLCGLTTQRSA